MLPKKPQVPVIKCCGIKYYGQLLNVALLHPPDMSSPAQLWACVLFVKKPSVEIWREGNKGSAASKLSEESCRRMR